MSKFYVDLQLNNFKSNDGVDVNLSDLRLKDHENVWCAGECLNISAPLTLNDAESQSEVISYNIHNQLIYGSRHQDLKYKFNQDQKVYIGNNKLSINGESAGLVDKINYFSHVYSSQLKDKLTL